MKTLIFVLIFPLFLAGQDTSFIVKVKANKALATTQDVKAVKDLIVLPDHLSTVPNYDKKLKAFKDAGLDRWKVVTVKKKDLSKQFAKQESSSDVEKVESIPVIINQWTPNDTYYATQYTYHLHNDGTWGTADVDIDAPEAWEIEKGNSSILVAVIDYKINYNHEDLSGNIWENIGWNFVENEPITDQFTNYTHGTFIAGIIAGETNNSVGISGIAGGSGSNDGVKLVSLICGDEDKFSGDYYAILSSIAYTTFMDIPLINLSQATYGSCSFGCTMPVALADVIDFYNELGGGDIMEGGLLIAAAGNDNYDTAMYPASYSGAIGVTNIDSYNHKGSSNYGSTFDLAAFGTALRSTSTNSTNNGYSIGSGTSYATPVVVGVAALVLSHYPGVFTREELIEILLESSDDVDTDNPTYAGKLGTGRVNALGALEYADSLYQDKQSGFTPTGSGALIILK